MIGGVFSQDQHGITVFNLRERRCFDIAFQDTQQQAANFSLGTDKTGIEIIFTDQGAQNEVGFQRCSRRSDADDGLRVIEKCFDMRQGILGRGDFIDAIFVTNPAGGDSIVTIHIASAESAAIAEEVTIDFTVVAVMYATQLPVALRYGDIAAKGTAGTNSRCRLKVPFSRVMGAQCLVGKNTGRANFYQVSGKLILQNAVAGAAEVNPVPGGKC